MQTAQSHEKAIKMLIKIESQVVGKGIKPAIAPMLSMRAKRERERLYQCTITIVDTMTMTMMMMMINDGIPLLSQ